MRTLSLLLVLVLAAALLPGPAARAGLGGDPDPTLVCRLGRVPASTLLLPYFEVQTKRQKGDVQIVLQNAGPAAILAHVTLWTDLAVPVVAFDVPMTGFDVERIRLFDVLFAPPVLPEPGYASLCGEPRTELDPPCLERIRAALSGNETEPGSGECLGFPHGDGRFRGYATVDAVGGGSPAASQVLLGDFELREKKAVFAGPLVHLRGTEELPLAPVWAARFENALAPPSKSGPGTELLVWRDASTSGALACGAPPEGADQAGVVGFDEEENPVQLDPARRVFPLAAQRVRVGSETLPLGFDAGWLLLDLNETAAPGRPAYVASLFRKKKAALFVEGVPLCDAASSVPLRPAR